MPVGLAGWPIQLLSYSNCLFEVLFWKHCMFKYLISISVDILFQQKMFWICNIYLNIIYPKFGDTIPELMEYLEIQYRSWRYNCYEACMSRKCSTLSRRIIYRNNVYLNLILVILSPNKQTSIKRTPVQAGKLFGPAGVRFRQV